jgi:hypothetical protein
MYGTVNEENSGDVIISADDGWKQKKKLKRGKYV